MPWQTCQSMGLQERLVTLLSLSDRGARINP